MMKEARYRPNALAFTIAPVHTDFPEKVGAFAEGVLAPSQWEPDERIPFPGTTRFIHDFRSFSGKLPTYHAGSAYSGCQILEKAVLHTGSTDQQKIRDFVSSLDTATVIGRFKVDHTGRQIGHNPILIQWQDGKKEIVYPAKMSTSLPKFGP
jgi:branched-chain amino acid transport system substrate-binding protein